MAIRNRNTLIEGFSKGQRPTADDFKNLIDSSVNILDDGFSKDAQSGIKLAPMSEQEGTVMTFLQSMTEDGGRWEFDVLDYDMRISRVAENEKRQVILLKQSGEIELGEEGCDITVHGTLHTEQRSGRKTPKPVPADGKWHDITGLLEGVYALEVVCVMGKKQTGKHAILVANATHCFGAKPRIRKIRSHFGVFGNKLKLRWVRSNQACKLQVRTRLKPGNDIFIHSFITSLWDNPSMENL